MAFAVLLWVLVMALSEEYRQGFFYIPNANPLP
jgi:hypothetical protein